MAINHDALRSALEQFRESGDYAGLLHTLSDGKKEVNNLLLFQHALQTTDDPDLRDMVDAAAWACANTQPLLRRPSEQSLDLIVKAAIQAYGPFITNVLSNLRDLAAALLTETRMPPPVSAVVAALGLHAQENAEVHWLSEDSFGEEMRYFSTRCQTCGGKDGGQGYVLCPECSCRARRDLEAMIADGSVTLSGEVDTDDLPGTIIIDFMKNGPKRYGCTKCKKTPVRDCDCAMIIQVPDDCQDGWIVQGTRPVRKEQFYAILRVRE